MACRNVDSRGRNRRPVPLCKNNPSDMRNVNNTKIIQLSMPLFQKISSKDNLNHGICAFTGCEIILIKTNLNFFWDKVSNNWADYFTNHHSAKHHKKDPKIYSHD